MQVHQVDTFARHGRVDGVAVQGLQRPARVHVELRRQAGHFQQRTCRL